MEKAQSMKEKDRLKLLTMAAIEKEAKQDGTTSGILDEIRENMDVEEEEAPMSEPTQEQPQEEPKGLMSRGAV